MLKSNVITHTFICSHRFLLFTSFLFVYFLGPIVLLFLTMFALAVYISSSHCDMLFVFGTGRFHCFLSTPASLFFVHHLFFLIATTLPMAADYNASFSLTLFLNLVMAVEGWGWVRISLFRRSTLHSLAIFWIVLAPSFFRRFIPSKATYDF